jgi:hypothetical protein
VLLDFLFIAAVSAVVSLVVFTLIEHLQAVMRIAGEATGGLINIYNQTAQVTTGLSGVAQSAEFQYHMGVIFKYLVILILAIYVLWVIFQGLSWYLVLCSQDEH